MEQLARDLFLIKTLVSNAYLVGNSESWVLVDALIPGHARIVKQCAEACFGPTSTPDAIVLTHGHMDHSGSAAALADFWRVKILAHGLEHPYLTGRCFYPPLDHTTPGFFSFLSRLYPASSPNLGERLVELDTDRPPTALQSWQIHFTPGHSPGHLAFFCPERSLLLAGDAITTMNLDNFARTVMQRKEVCGPPAPATIDWQQAHRSVGRLADLRPGAICPGHGKPMFGAANELRHLADRFPIPPHGRYVREPAITDEHGIRYLPPAPPDVTPGLLAGAGVAALALACLRRRRRN